MPKMTNAQVFEFVGLDRDQIVAAIARMGEPPKEIKRPGAKPRPICKVCGNRINARTCQPYKPKRKHRDS
jgi:hypothetical protein